MGQWRNSDTTELIEIISDTIYYYEIVDSCYNLDKITYTDSVNVSYTLQNNNVYFLQFIGYRICRSYTLYCFGSRE